MEENKVTAIEMPTFKIEYIPQNKVRRIMALAQIELNSRLKVDQVLNKIENEVELEFSASNNDDDKRKRTRYNDHILKIHELFTDPRKNYEEDIFEIEGGSEMAKEILHDIIIGDLITLTTKRKSFNAIVESIEDDILVVRNDDKRRLDFTFRQLVEGKVKVKKQDK